MRSLSNAICLCVPTRCWEYIYGELLVGVCTAASRDHPFICSSCLRWCRAFPSSLVLARSTRCALKRRRTDILYQHVQLATFQLLYGGKALDAMVATKGWDLIRFTENQYLLWFDVAVTVLFACLASFPRVTGAMHFVPMFCIRTFKQKHPLSWYIHYLF